MNSKLFGVQSKRFGSTAFGKIEGSINKYGSKFKVGWDKHNGSNYFRIGYGRSYYYNNTRGKLVITSKKHINILRVRHK